MKAKNKSTSKPRCSKKQGRWQYSGSTVDQGNSGRSCSLVGSFPSLGSSCKRNRRYPKGSSLLRLAVSITLKHRALASAPLAVSQNKKFLLAITNGLAAEFLEGFHGYLETDAFSGYKALEKEQTQITAAFCWAHARRDFSDALKAVGAKRGVAIPQEGSVAAQALAKIAEIYHLEGLLKDLSPEERLRRRQQEIAPLVEAYLTWAKAQDPLQIVSKKTRDGLAYSLNQEKQLRMFLQDGEIPVDNSASERAIRPFTVWRKNWMMLNTPKGAQSSAILYSIAETAKANNLKPYEYFRFLLDEITEHLYGREHDPNDRAFLNDLLPWSDKLPDVCKKII